MPRDLQYLLDRTDITDLLIEYATTIDTRNFPALNHIFTPDAIIDYTATGGPRCTLTQAKTFLTEALPQFPRSQHLIANINIKLQGNTATARTMCHNPMVKQHPDGNEQVMFFGIWYDNTLIRTNDGWRINRLSQELCYTHNTTQKET